MSAAITCHLFHLNLDRQTDTQLGDLRQRRQAVVAVLGKNIWGEAAPSSFGRQQRLSEITFYTGRLYYFTLM